ncbi:hypothetical protein KI387_037418 [Taxus chinensis]|uniref:XS domain-containing protein n=1 Tax=Taxus chinensis TaxID=29808 RepID=A0AA38FSJ2_TAXCH|nr:hypothetical protein KI387_037418 [Taxus chinensis]
METEKTSESNFIKGPDMELLGSDKTSLGARSSEKSHVEDMACLGLRDLKRLRPRGSPKALTINGIDASSTCNHLQSFPTSPHLESEMSNSLDRNMGEIKTSAITPRLLAKRGRTSEDDIMWPPAVIIENTRLAKAANGCWTGIGNTEMARILQEIGHTYGRPKAAWGKEGHRGQIAVQYQPTLEGLREAERLHEHFKVNARGREEWGRVHPFWNGLPGHEGLEEGPDFVRVDETTKQKKRVLYGYLAVVSDMEKVPKKKKQKWCMTVNKRDVKAMAACQLK